MIRIRIPTIPTIPTGYDFNPPWKKRIRDHAFISKKQMPGTFGTLGVVPTLKSDAN